MSHLIDEATPAWSESHSSHQKKSAFTLVEMLVVAAVIVLILGITVPVFNGMLVGRGVEKGINSVTGVVELARTTAVANQTFVWVLFKNATNSDNNAELRCTVVTSVSGLNNNQPSNLRALTGLIKMSGIKNVQRSDMPQALKDIAPSDADESSFLAYPTDSSDFPAFTVAGQSFEHAPYLCVSATGEIATTGDTYNLLFEPKVCVGLVETTGTTVRAGARDGAIITVYGGSARTRVSRP